MTSVQFSSFAYLALLLTFFIIHQVTGGRRVEVYRFCAGYSFDSLSGQTGKYTIEKGPHSGVTCTWPGPSGSSYHLKWQHGDLEGGHEYHLPYNSTLGCVQCIYYNKDGYYIDFPDAFPPTEDHCYVKGNDWGYEVFRYGEVPKHFRTEEYEEPTYSPLDELIVEYEDTTKTTPSTPEPPLVTTIPAPQYQDQVPAYYPPAPAPANAEQVINIHIRA